MKNLIAILFLVASHVVFAQDFSVDYNNYKFDDSALTAPLMDSVGFHSSKHWARTYKIFAADEKLGEGMFEIQHELVQVNDEAGVESYNKISVPVYNNQYPIEVLARVIRDGKVVSTADKSNIKTVKEEDVEDHRIALESVLPGSFIETIIIVQQPIEFSGTEYLQHFVPIKELLVCLVTPDFIELKTKIYNSEAETKVKTNEERLFNYYLKRDVEAAQREEYCFLEAHVPRLEFVLKSTSSGGTGSKWGDVGSRIYHAMMDDYEPAKSKLKKALKTIGVDSKMSEVEKVKLIENYIKSNILIAEGLPVANVTDPMDMKMGSGFAINRLTCCLMKAAGVNFQLYGMSSRETKSIDSSFPSNNYVTYIILYFPNLDEFIDPMETNYRYPMISTEYLGQNAIIIMEEELGGVLTPITMTGKTKANKEDDSKIVEQYKISLNPDKGTYTMDLHKEYFGYGDHGLRMAYFYIPEDKRTDLYENTIKSMLKESKVESVTIANEDLSDLTQYEKPLTVDAKLTGTDMLEFAGDKIILNLGHAIGQQSELYNAKPRMYPIDIDFLHYYTRSLEIEIPEGYAAEGLDKLVKNFDFKNEKGERLFSFISNYEIKGNKIIISITESYDKLGYGVEHYENFAKVVNGAADFNKAAIVFVKS